MSRISAILVVLAACGNGGPKHWKDQPLVEYSGTSEGHGYTIQMPTGMQASKSDAGEYAYHQDVNGEGYVFAPRVNVHFTPSKQTVDDALKMEKEPPLSKQALPDGWMYSQENPYSKGKNNYIVYAEHDLPDGALTCNAQVYPMSKSGDDDVRGKLLPLVEKMCASLKAK